MAQGIDFTALIRGEQAADNANWADIQRIQQQQKYGIQREDDLYNQQLRRTNRDATHYLSTFQLNMQRLAADGRDPTQALIGQLNATKMDPAFQAMPSETQDAILSSLGQSAAVRAKILKDSGDYEGVKTLTSAFGVPNPVNQVGAAIATGDPLRVVAAINAQAPGAATLSDDKQFVIDSSGAKIPLNQYVAYVSAAGSAAGASSASYAYGQQQRTEGAADTLKTEQQTQQKQALQTQLWMLHQSNPGSITAEGIASLEQANGIVLDPAFKESLLGTAVSAGAWQGAPYLAPAGGFTPGVPNIASVLPGMAAPGVVAGFNLGPAVAPAAATPAPAPMATPVAPDAISQLVTQIQSASAPQLASSMATINRQIAQGNERRAALDSAQQILQQQLKIYTQKAAVENLALGGRAKVNGPANLTLESIQKQLDQINAEYQTIESNMRNIEKLSRQIQARSQTVSLPSVNLGTAPAEDWATQLQGTLSQ